MFLVPKWGSFYYIRKYFILERMFATKKGGLLYFKINGIMYQFFLAFYNINDYLYKKCNRI